MGPSAMEHGRRNQVRLQQGAAGVARTEAAPPGMCRHRERCEAPRVLTVDDTEGRPPKQTGTAEESFFYYVHTEQLKSCS